MMSKSKIFFLALILSFSTELKSQSTPSYSNEYMNIGVDARSLGMMRSVVASVDDVTAGYWNPAGLTQIKDPFQLAFMHSNYFSGLASYNYFGLATRVKQTSALSFSFVRLAFDNIPYTLDLVRNGQINYNNISSFSATDMGFLISYAQKSLNDKLSFGGSAKIIRRRGGSFAEAWGFGIDVGMQYRTKNNWRFGIMARDITSTFNAWNFSFTEEEKDLLAINDQELPQNSLEIALPRFLMGAAKYWKWNKFSILAETNLEVTTDGQRNVLLYNTNPTFGIELGLFNKIFLRGGYGDFQEIQNSLGETNIQATPNFGIGLNLGIMQLDYSLMNVVETGGIPDSHVFSIKLKIQERKGEDKKKE